MNKKILVVLLIGVVFLSLFGVIGSATLDSCSLVQASSCSNSNTVLKLYKTTNSHGEIIGYFPTPGMTGKAVSSKGTSGTLEDYALCCSFTGSRGCTSSGSNEVLSLSSPSNAHAEIPSLNNYNNRVCFDGLSCIGIENPTASDLKSYPIKMLSLSSDTNAHLAHYSNLDYSYKILCKKTNNNPPPANLENAIFNFQNTANPLKLNSNQIGTGASKVTVKITNLNALQGTSVFMNVCEKDLIPSPTGTPSFTPSLNLKTASNTDTPSFAPSLNLKTVSKRISNFFFQFIQSIIKLTGKAVGTPGDPGQLEICTLITTEQGNVVNNGDAIFEWTISNSDLIKANEPNGQYEFYFNITVGEESRMFEDKPLNVIVQKQNNSNQNKNKFWLDSNRKTKITQKKMNWENLTKTSPGINVSNNSGIGISASVIRGLGTTWTLTLKDSNLVYMAASGLPLAANTIVYFEIYEKDSSEGGLDDTIITGSSISASVGADGNVSASWQVSQENINAARSEDNVNPDGSITYEFYFKIIDPSTRLTYDFLGDGVLDLTIVFPTNVDSCGNGKCEPELGETSITCPADCKKTTGTYLKDAKGAWADETLEYEITDYEFVEGQENVVGLFVGFIDLMNEIPENLYFEIWERDSAIPESNSDGLNNNSLTIDYDDAILADGSLNSLISEEGIATSLWSIQPEQLALAGQEDFYEFYFKIRYKDESKSFRDILLNLSIGEGLGGGGGGGGGSGEDECEGVNYCSDHLTKPMCNSPCEGVLGNEGTLNAEADCSNLNVDCYCFWNEVDDECSFAYSNSLNTIGLCEYTQANVQEDCEDSGYLITSYNAFWSWQSDNCYSSLDECLLTIGNGADQSCSQADGCWRKINSIYVECENYDELTLCSYSGPGSIGSQIKEESNLWWIILLIFGILVILTLIFFFIARKKMKENREKELFQTKQNLQNISSYISREKKKGIPNYEIKTKLLKSGWTNAQVDYALKKVSKHMGKNPTNVAK